MCYFLVGEHQLESLHDHIAVAGIYFHPVADPVSLLGGQHGGSGTKEEVDHETALRAAVPERVSHDRYRLHRWMHGGTLGPLEVPDGCLLAIG